jgi:regulator of protease activity HflC (stomatin/prohibitin superfamily)
MAEEKAENKDIQSHVPEKPVADELDAAGKSLSEALRLSFIILKIIMIVLVIAFLASGFKTVGPDEQALVLQFGKIKGVGEERLLGPGLHWIWPYPIDEIVKIPVERTIHLPIDSFWYHELAKERISGQTRIRPSDPLKPLEDGYSLTRGEQEVGTVSLSEISVESTISAQVDNSSQQQSEQGNAGSDYNIVHTRWQLTYKIDNPERFFKNLQVRDVKPGENYYDVVTEEMEPFLTSLFEDAVVQTMVNYTIDQAISSRDRIPRDVAGFLQDKLDAIESGINVVSVQLTNSVYPPQVKAAFEESILARQQRDKVKTKAQEDAYRILSEAAGPVARELYAALHDETVSEERKEYLWSQIAGTAQEKLSDAQIYATKVVKDAEANANYLKNLLPEYRQRPELVVQRLYLDAIEKVINNAEEKFFVQSTQGAKGKEIRVLINKDQLIKSKKIAEQAAQQGQ